MKFMADENFPRPAVSALRAAGLDVSWIAEGHAGISDEEVLEHCRHQRRTLLTWDKDFGELAFHRALPPDCGVVLFRIVPKDPLDVASIVLVALRSRNDWAGHFSVITRHRIRVRRLR